MNNKESSGELLEEARLILQKDIPSAREANNYRLMIRRSQEVVELTIKAFIKASGYEYPKVHDPAPLLTKICREKGVSIASASLEKIQKISASLAEERAPAFYAERSYSADEAQEAGKNAEFVFKALASLIA
jgi:HEPN domain-containing protein